MGLLDGDLAKSIYAGFKGKLLTGIYRLEAVPSSAGNDDHGDPLITDPEDVPMQGFWDEYNLAFKAQAGIPQGDVKVCIFAESMPDVKPSQDGIVRFDTPGKPSRWFQIRQVQTDPATALWTCQSFEIEAPQ